MVLPIEGLPCCSSAATLVFPRYHDQLLQAAMSVSDPSPHATLLDPTVSKDSRLQPMTQPSRSGLHYTESYICILLHVGLIAGHAILFVGFGLRLEHNVTVDLGQATTILSITTTALSQLVGTVSCLSTEMTTYDPCPYVVFLRDGPLFWSL